MSNTNTINVKTLLQYIPQDILEHFASETRVDYQVKKLDGDIIFKLLLFTLVSNNRNSLRILEETFHTRRFQHYAGVAADTTTKHTSLADRLATIDLTYFQKLFEHTSALCTHHVPKKEYHRSQPLLRFDSTVVSASAKLLHMGMTNGLPNKHNEHRLKNIKFSVGFNGLFATSATLFTEQRHLGEDVTLRQAILEHSENASSIIVFDRGLKKRATFTEFSQRGIHFVTRINPTTMYDELAPCSATADPAVVKDICVYLYARGVRVKTLLRLIIYRPDNDSEPLFFITNLFEESPDDIATLYRRRWDIEVFFRFIKQEFSFSHLLARNANGILVMMYMTLIAAMLIAVYKHLNNVSSYRIAKIRFANELEDEVLKCIIVLCNGDPGLLHRPHLHPGFGH
jgi:hypothetical protein